MALARQAIENALGDWDLGAAFFVLREHGSGHDPARTVVDRVLASARRGPALPVLEAAPVAAGTPRALRPRDPLDALVHRRAAVLRRVVIAEHAVREAAASLAGSATTIEAAQRALALKRRGTGAVPDRLRRLARRLVGEASRLPSLPAIAPSVPIAALPRRPQAP